MNFLEEYGNLVDPQPVSLLPKVVVVFERQALSVENLVVLHEKVLGRVQDHPAVQPGRQGFEKWPKVHKLFLDTLTYFYLRQETAQ